LQGVDSDFPPLGSAKATFAQQKGEKCFQRGEKLKETLLTQATQSRFHAIGNLNEKLLIQAY